MNNKLGEDLGIDMREKQHLVEELQLAKRGAVQSMRNVVGEVVAVTVRPADSTHRETVVATGKTRELRARSVVAHVTRPVAIGGFYELTLDGSTIDVPAAFARCDQITMLGEDLFEARFQFLQPMTLPGDSQARSD